jgi:hypothetical protein
MAYNADLRFCGSVGDIYRLWLAIREKNLIQPKTFAMMATPEGAAMHMSLQDPKAAYGFALIVNHEEEHKRIGQHGSLLGYSGSLYDFPDDGLTIVVLTNTEGQNAYAITRALARAELGLPQLPAPSSRNAQRILDNEPVSPQERKQLTGTYVLKLDRLTENLHDSFAQYRRTLRVFDEDGRLMIQPLGEGPERLQKQKDGSFAMRSKPESRVTFALQGGSAASMKIDPSDFGVAMAGDRVGPGDPQTFHRQWH